MDTFGKLKGGDLNMLEEIDNVNVKKQVSVKRINEM